MIKETLRLDNPAVNTFGYETFHNVEICGVPIPKGTLIRFDLFAAHLNPIEWQRPKEFIPERFDPTSEFYKKPNNAGKPRSIHSWLGK